jgi:hypothetical protein
MKKMHKGVDCKHEEGSYIKNMNAKEAGNDLKEDYK